MFNIEKKFDKKQILCYTNHVKKERWLFSMCVIIICFTSLLFITVMLYFYLVLADSNNKKMKVTKEDIANCKARILVLEYMEKHNIDTLNINDILTIFPISNNEVKKND